MLVHELEEIPLRTDDLDRKILARLVDNGRESFAALGQRVGLSTAATKRRVDRLRSEGVIRRFTADLEPAAMGWTIDAFVELYCEGRVPPDRMRDMVRSIPEVIEAYTVTGESDGILRVRGRRYQPPREGAGGDPQLPGCQPDPIRSSSVPAVSLESRSRTIRGGLMR